jgi:hypothetical protein
MRKKIRVAVLVVLGVLGLAALFVAGKLGRGPLKESNAVRIYNDEPVRITGKIEDHEIDQGADKARGLHTLLVHATSPGLNKCARYGFVTLHYASGRTVDIQVGCCTAWINHKSWHVGDGAMRNFFDAK